MKVFKALADASRPLSAATGSRPNGQTTEQLSDGLAMTRQPVTKHSGSRKRGQTWSPRSAWQREVTLPQSRPIHQIGETLDQEIRARKARALSRIENGNGEGDGNPHSSTSPTSNHGRKALEALTDAISRAYWFGTGSSTEGRMPYRFAHQGQNERRGKSC